MKRNLRFLLLLCSLWMLAALPVQAMSVAQRMEQLYLNQSRA
ncbi:hypothetical protein [uncultured Alistipes sp.]|nr:hypothetical protein [uncultured Alistipes sp.]